MAACHDNIHTTGELPLPVAVTRLLSFPVKVAVDVRFLARFASISQRSRHRGIAAGLAGPGGMELSLLESNSAKPSEICIFSEYPFWQNP